jgi:hypothetical protein
MGLKLMDIWYNGIYGSEKVQMAFSRIRFLTFLMPMLTNSLTLEYMPVILNKALIITRSLNLSSPYRKIPDGYENDEKAAFIEINVHDE